MINVDLRRLSMKQLIEVDQLAHEFSAWVNTAALLRKIGMPCALSVEAAHEYRARIEQVTR